MKRKFLIMLAIEAAACLILSVFGLKSGVSSANVFELLLSFPFKQAGQGLRMLSLSGAIGNAAAFVLYCAICLTPAAYCMLRLRKGRAKAEEGLLILLSIALFVIMYMFINPALIERSFMSAAFSEMGMALLGTALYSIIAGYIVIRVMRILENNEGKSLYNYLRIVLGFICAAIIFSVFAAGLFELFASIAKLKAENTATFRELLTSYIFLSLQYIVKILPLIFEFFIINAGMRLLTELELDAYSNSAIAAANKTGRFAKLSVVATMLFSILVNILQLANSHAIRSSNYSLTLPLMSIAFAFIVMLLAGYFERAAKIKNENDMII